MQLYLVEHGEPDYTEAERAGYMGHGLDLAKLTERGRKQAEMAAEDSRLKSAEIIIASPYTRALQTAAILSQRLNKPLTVETFLHEWMPDVTFQYRNALHMPEILEEMRQRGGEWDESCQYHWESISHVGERVFTSLRKYLSYSSVIVAAHGLVIQRFVKAKEVSHGSVWEVDFQEDSVPLGYYE